jgi:thiol:disulfide interchange protein
MKDIKLVRVDLSEQNEQNASISSRFGLVGLPSVALFKHNQKVVVLSGLYNSNDFMDALNNYLPEHGKQ